MRAMLLAALLSTTVALASLGCASQAGREARSQLRNIPTVDGAVTGVIEFETQPPSDAVVLLKLVDVTDGEMEAVPVASAVVTDLDGEIVAFELPYQPGEIDPARDYVVEARVTRGGDLLYIVTDAARVITRGRPTRALLVMEPVG